MTRKQRRVALLAGAAAVLTLAAVLVLTALEDSIVFFYSPSDIEAKGVGPGERIRLGGLVAEGSLKRGDGLTISFEVTDLERTISVTYTGVLPDLFREGQGVVTEGMLDPSGGFAADTVLAKHDENYMPPEVADALKDKGVWQHMQETADDTLVTN